MGYGEVFNTGSDFCIERGATAEYWYMEGERADAQTAIQKGSEKSELYNVHSYDRAISYGMVRFANANSNFCGQLTKKNAYNGPLKSCYKRFFSV